MRLQLHNAFSKLKNIGFGVLGIGIIALLILVVVFGILVAVWVGSKALPYLYAIAWICLGLTILVFLPLAFIKKTRHFGVYCIYGSSFVYGITLWFLGLLLTAALWGYAAVLIGLIFLGIGVVPFAMLATLFKGMWGELGALIVLTILTFGTRALALWLGTKIPEGYDFTHSYQETEMAGLPNKRMSKLSQFFRWIAVLPGSIGCAMLVLFPIHWAVQLVTIPVQLFVPFAQPEREMLEFFGNAFFVPMVLVTFGALIAPRFKFHTGIGVAILFLVAIGCYVLGYNQNIDMSPVRYAITIILWVTGVTCGLYNAYNAHKKSSKKIASVIV
jgi:hypothetical protein